MNSIERVKAAIYFNNPDRVPTYNLVSGDLLPLPMVMPKNWRPGWGEGEEGLFPYVRGAYNWERPEWANNNPLYEGENWRKIPHQEIDLWGCIWNQSGKNDTIGHPGRASLPSWDDYNDYMAKYTPDPTDKSMYTVALDLKRRLGQDKYRAVILNCLGPSDVAANMRGFSNFLVDHAKHPQELKILLENITEYQVQCMRMSKKIGLDPHGFFMYNDLGEQNGPFVSPRTFQEFYKPVLGRLYDEAHSLKCEFHHHCCGKIDKILPHMIEWGLDAIEFDSPRMTGYPALQKFRGKIMMWGCINIQTIYPFGTPEEVEREVWHMVRNLGTKEGGFGAYFYPQIKDLLVPRKNVRAFEKGLKKYGNYENIPEIWWDYPLQEEWKDDVVPPLPTP